MISWKCPECKEKIEAIGIANAEFGVTQHFEIVDHREVTLVGFGEHGPIIAHSAMLEDEDELDG